MSASNRNQNSNPLYPEVILSNPDANSPFSSSSSSASTIYPSVETKELAENLFPEDDTVSQTPTLQSFENILVRVPGVVVHLIEKDQSVELACGELVIVGLNQGDNTVAVLARVGDEIQWPLAKDEAAVKLDESHYFFSLRVPASGSLDNDEKAEDFGGKESEMLNYGLTIASKGQEGVLKELDQVLEKYSCFSVKEVGDGEVLDGFVAREMAPEELEEEDKRELMVQSSAAYWTTLAPNVEDYSGRVARLIAAGSEQLIRGILWCGDVTVDRLKWGNEFLKKRMGPGSTSEISPETMRRIERVKKLTKMTEKMASGVLSGVVKVSGFFTSSIVNSKVGKKFFSLLPGEIVLASLDGFSRVCDAVEVAGRNVMSTTSVVTTGLVSQRYKLGKQHKLSPMFGMEPGFGQDIMYGEQAAQVTSEGLDAAGHAIGTAWAVFKIRKAFNPKSILKPTNLAKAAAETNSSALESKYKK